MRPTLVVVPPPSFDLPPSVVNRFEPVNVQAFVALRTVEALDESVVDGFARSTEVETDPVVIGPQIKQMARELATVVDENPHWRTACCGNALADLDEVVAAQPLIDPYGKRFSRIDVDDCQARKRRPSTN